MDQIDLYKIICIQRDRKIHKKVKYKRTMNVIP